MAAIGMRSSVFVALALGSCLGVQMPALAQSEPLSGRLTGDRLSAAFVGKVFRGVYEDGVNWREAYLVDGEVDYEDDFAAARGEWFVRDDLLCTFYDGDLTGGCFIVMQRSENCFDFYAVDPATDRPDASRDAIRSGFDWTAQGWRSDRVPTCPEGLVS